MTRDYNYSQYNAIIKKYLKKNNNVFINSLSVVCTINKNFFLSNKDLFLKKEKLFYFKLLFAILKISVKFFILLGKNKSKIKTSKKTILFLSHSVIIDKKKITDNYFKEIINYFKIKKSKFDTKYILQTNKLLIKNDNYFNGNSLEFFEEIKIFITLIKLCISKLSLDIFRLDNFSKKILLDIVSGNTYKNVRIANEILNYLKKNNIKKIFITYEGHGYEKLICYYLRTYLPNIRVYGYQTTCMSKDQSFLLNPKINLIPHKILLSRKTDINLFKFKNLFFDPIYLGKIRPYKKKRQYWKLFNNKNQINILILIDRFNKKDLNQIFNFSMLFMNNKKFKLTFRPHPVFYDYFKKYYKYKTLSNVKNFFIDNSASIKNLFIKNHIVIFNQSSLFIKSFSLGIFPIYFKYNSENFEDIFDNIKKPTLNHSNELIYLINNFKKINRKYQFKRYLSSEKNFLFNRNNLLKKIFS
jgi:hypothetical protein